MNNFKELSPKEMVEIEGGDPFVLLGQIGAALHHAGVVGIGLGAAAGGGYLIGTAIYNNYGHHIVDGMCSVTGNC